MAFAKGQSGNPQGRPPRTDTERAQREAIRAALPGIIETLVELAKSGDTEAARLLMDRALPALKPQDQAVNLPLGSDLTQASAVVLAGLTAGALTPDQGAAIAGVLSALVRVREATELEQRITKLEESANGNS